MSFKSVSFAILGQLAFRPWSAYELIQEMKRNFHYFYPRAESGLYAELKKLEQAGYVRSSQETRRNKDRRVYTITPEGSRVLEAWLDTDPGPIRLEFEGLLRVFLARFGSSSGLKKTLEMVREENDDLVQLAKNVGNEYLSGTAPGQKEIIQRAMIFDFLLHYSKMYEAWLDRTESYLHQIENKNEAKSIEHARSVFRALMEVHGMKPNA